MIRQRSSIPCGSRTKTGSRYNSPKDGGRIVFSVNATKIDGYADLMGFKSIVIDRNDDESKTFTESNIPCLDIRCSEDFLLANNTYGNNANVVHDEGHIRVPRKLQGTVADVVGLYPKQPKSALKSPQLRKDKVRFGHWGDSMVPPLNKHRTSSYHRDCRTLGIIRDREDGVPNLRATPVRSVTFLSDTETSSSNSH